MTKALLLSILLCGCSAKVSPTAEAPCDSPELPPDPVEVIADSTCSTQAPCTDAKVAYDALSAAVRTCFPASVADVYALIPSVRIAASGCPSSFAWNGGAEYDAAKRCLQQTLRKYRYSCLATPGCTTTTTVRFTR